MEQGTFTRGCLTVAGSYEAGKAKVFLTSLPVTKPLEVLDLYDLRSLIENTAFRELKQGWCLKQYPWSPRFCNAPYTIRKTGTPRFV